MKKLCSGFLIFIALLFTTSSIEAAESTESFVNKLKRSTPNGYHYEDHLLIQMNNSKPLEVVSIFKSEDEYWNDYMIYVHELKNGEWKIAYKRPVEYRSNLTLVTKGRLGANDKVVVGSFEGSGSFMEAFLIGSPNGRDIRLMQQKDGYFYGNATILNGVLYYMNSSVTIDKYKVEKGKMVAAEKPNGRDDRLVANNPKVWLGLVARKGTTDYVGKRVMTVKVGDRIGIGRYGVSDTRAYAYRFYTTSGDSLDWDFKRPALVAKRKGTQIIQFEPEPYADPIELKIVVK